MKTSDHIVRSYDEELRRLASAIAQLGGMAEIQLASALQAVAKRDSDLAATVVAGDSRVDEKRAEVDEMAVRLLALRQPMAIDLRAIVGSIRAAGDIERIADYAANVAKRAIALNQAPLVRPVAAIPRMGALVQAMIKDVLDAYIASDADKAAEVWARDEEVDEMYNSLFRELLTYMMEDPRSITTCTHLLFIAKNIERIGDHATNLAEFIHFIVKGTYMKAARPKGDTTTSFAMPADGGK